MFMYEADAAAIDLAVTDMPAEAQPVIRDLPPCQDQMRHQGQPLLVELEG